MGTTVLTITMDASRPGSAVLSFRGRKGGARRWREIVDTLAPLCERIARRNGLSIECLDPRKSPGRGARLRVPLKVAALAVARVEARFRAEVRRNELDVVADRQTQPILSAARRIVRKRATASRTGDAR